MSDDLLERLQCGVATYDDMADAVARMDAQETEIARLRAACDASEERERAIELRFWQTVDRDGLTGLPSDMWAALEQLVRDRAELATARREGMEASADLCDDLPDHQGGICAIAIRMMIDEEDKKAARRAAAKEGEP